MKARFFFPVSALFLAALFFQSCAINSTLINSQQVTVTHEHQVDLPAAMYSPGASNTPMFEKKGDISLSVNMTDSGKNTNDDSNPEGNPAKVTEGTTHQNISKAKTFTVNGGYALTDKIGLTGSFTTGKTKEEYRPYIESWNLTKETYSTEYWVGIPVWWDTWIGGTWYSTENVQAINDYQKVSKTLTRSYKYYDGELAIGKYTHKNKFKTGLYGGLGFAQNQYDGHLNRGASTNVYGHHEASFFKVFVLPSVAFRAGWLELGAAIKGSFLNYNLKSTVTADRKYAAASDNLFFVEPSLFIRFGPRAFRVNVEQKWLNALGKSPFSTNKAFTSIGVISTLNLKK